MSIEAPGAQPPSEQEQKAATVRREASVIALSAMQIAETGRVEVRIEVCAIGVAFDEDAARWGARVSGLPNGDTCRLSASEMMTLSATFAGVADALNLRHLTARDAEG